LSPIPISKTINGALLKNTTTNKDEINLRELFSTIGRYKWSIIFFTIILTLAVAAKVYFMPKYYKSTVTLEVKSEEKSGGFSMSGAAAMLLGGSGGGSANLDKDITLFKMYRVNSKALDQVKGYMVRYFIKNEKYQEVEVDSNLSIKVTDVKINNFKDYGLRLKVQPINAKEYSLFRGDDTLGTFHYDEIVNTDNFSLKIKKQQDTNTTYTIALAGSKRYVYEKIITKNLTIQANKKAPFITLSFLDTLPNRGEAYLKSLIEIYTQQSIDDIKNDAAIVLDSYSKQLQNIEKRVLSSSNRLESYKVKNSIIEPEAQATVLVKELSKVDIEIEENNYKQELLKSLITFAKTHENIDAIAPSLIELEDQPTIILIKMIQEQQLEQANLFIKYKPTHPDIVNGQRQIENLQSKVISNLENLKMTLKDKTQSLNKMKQRYIKKLKSAPREEQQLLTFSRDYKINQKMYTYLMQEHSAAEIKRDKAISRFKIIESIYTSKKAVKPKKALIVIVSFITIFILMIFISFFREFLKRNSNDSENS